MENICGAGWVQVGCRPDAPDFYSVIKAASIRVQVVQVFPSNPATRAHTRTRTNFPRGAAPHAPDRSAPFVECSDMIDSTRIRLADGVGSARVRVVCLPVAVPHSLGAAARHAALEPPGGVELADLCPRQPCPRLRVQNRVIVGKTWPIDL
jgi:hypothetical protein